MLHDVVKIASEDGFLQEIHVKAVPPQARIAYDTFLNFGFIKKNEEVSIDLKIKNTGKLPAKVEVVQEGLAIQLRVMQQFLNLPVDMEKSFQISFNPTNIGIFRSQISLRVDGVQMQQLIDVNATCVEFSRFITDQNGVQTNYINFNHVYFSEKSVIQTKLYNNTPVSVDFKIMIMEGSIKKDTQMSVFTPFEMGQQQTQKVLVVQPDQGSIRPYCAANIQLTFKTKVTDNIAEYVKVFAKA